MKKSVSHSANKINSETKTIIGSTEIDKRIPAVSQVVLRRVQKLEEEGKKVVLITVGKGGDYFSGLIRSRYTILVPAENLYTKGYRVDNTADKKREVLFFTGDETSLNGAVMIVVDDILDTGYTSEFVQQWCLEKGASSVEFVFLLRKPDCVKVHNINILAIGFDIKDIFVFGVGMDAYGLEVLRGHRSVCCWEQEWPADLVVEDSYWIPKEGEF